MKKIIWIFFLLPVSTYAGEFPDCHFHKEGLAYFSNTKYQDKVSVDISGSPCSKASVIITIADHKGQQIYEYETTIEPLTPTPDDPELDKEAEELTSKIIEPSNFEDTTALPKWRPNEEYCGHNYQELKVSKKYYEKLRRTKWRSFSHPIHYEGWQVVVYDRDKKKTIIISNGSP